MKKKKIKIKFSELKNLNEKVIRKLKSFPVVSHYGHNVSHAKNRTSRAFKYNLHKATIVFNDRKIKVRVPARVLKMLKKLKLTTHKF